ncbi:hypothetical protein TEQG_08242 [Trichophyton equinum CBS 127.97]|uniref:Uncharacterized protein n=1 Tax=Trichophyton equinum (strain ATCC MYA-4606 / CBS 127.97) TaxID=559882 RepID=F2Q573_TRIEC|nr:hypothetical protein TEQG_08242 [Trichophyton equinum CBS 127.97]
MSDYGTTSLNPSWDCRIHLNVNDSELRSGNEASSILTSHARVRYNLMASPHIKDLKRRPIGNLTGAAWKATNHNYMLRVAGSNQEEYRDFYLFLEWFFRPGRHMRLVLENKARY